MTDYRFPFDERLLLALNGLGWDWLDAVWVAASSRVLGLGAAVLFSLWLLSTLKRKAIRPVLQATLACAAADTLGHLVLKSFFHRLRPHFALPKGVVRQFAEATGTGASMPSLHAATSFAFAVALGLAVPGSLRITLPLAVLISVSRVAVGIHWPSDVAAGAIYGALMGLVFHGVFQLAWPASRHSH